jgi:hypothetical protein
MWKRCIDWYRATKPIIHRVWFEARGPLIVAVVWGVVVVWWYQGKTLLDSFSAGFAAFFFLFFLQGQVLRVHKNVRDEDNANEFKDSFASIRQVLEEIKTQRPKTSTGRTIVPTLPRPAGVAPFIDPQSFLVQAEHALEHDLIFPAMLVSAVGFEHAIRDTAARFGFDVRQPLSLLLTGIAQQTNNQETVQKLRGLVRLRNRLVHAEPDGTALDREEALEVIGAFREGIVALQDIATGQDQ